VPDAAIHPSRPPLAKLSRPSASGLVLRPRLLERLDAASRGRLAWVQGPAGAGKTSLVSSWLAMGARRHLWYQVDEADADPASFFHFLARGATAEVVSTKGARGKAVPALPPLTPEYLPHLEGYVRRYSSLLWERLGTPFVLVLDNFQALPADAPTQPLVAALVAELLPEAMLMVVSREPPPAVFARWLPDPGFCLLDGEQLRLDDDEAVAIAAARGLADRERAVALNRVARGWSAGLVLLVQAAHGGLTIAADDEPPPQPVLDYLSAALFAQVAEDDREALVRCALAPRLTPSLACALGGPRAGELLRELQRNHLFIDRVAGEGDEPEYELHPLFREFLLERAGTSLPPEERRELRACAARHFELREQIDAAVRLHAEAEAWPELARLVTTHAPSLLAAGRLQTVAAWIEHVPGEVRRGQPWLLHWLGVARLFPEAAEGRALLAQAYEGFDAAGDVVGQLLACAETLHSFAFDWRALAQSDVWIERYEALLGAEPSTFLQSLPPALATRVLAASQAIVVRDAARPGLERLIDLCERHGLRVEEPELQAQALCVPMLYWCWSGEFARVLELSRRVFAEVGRLTTPSYVMASFVTAMALWQTSREEEALRLVDQARERVHTSGVVAFDNLLDAETVITLMSLDRLDAAEATIGRCNPQGVARFENEWRNVRGGLHLMRGELQDALAVLKLALQEARGGKFWKVATEVQLGYALMLSGRHEEARDLFAEALAFAAAMPSPITEFHTRVALAYSFLVAGDDIASGQDHLRRALAIGAAHDYLNCHPWRLAHVLSFLFSRALEENIEPDYVRRFIRRRNLRPDSPEVPGWPWPLRIYALGHLRVRREEAPLPTGRKAQRRVLELLGAIVALGPRSATRNALVDALWSELEGDAGVDAFEAALYRLRKLLGNDEAVRLEHSVVTLDPGVVWIDAEAFERLADEVERGVGEGEITPPLQLALDKAFALYKGPLLDGEEERPFLLAARQRLGSRLIRLAQGASDAFMRSHLHARAVDVLARAIEIEPLAEDLHRRLIEALTRAGRRAEAIAAYRRCEQLLGRVLGERPSPDTERAADELRARPQVTVKR
jgi:ATP/maltotriose-dependent transcriptional regulator MalT